MVMAMHTWCSKCDVDTLHHNNKCTVCEEREHRIARAKWFASTDSEKIEILLRRIIQLEREPIKY